MQAEQLGDPGGHGCAVRADPRLLADQRDVDMLDAAARGRDKVTGVRQKDGRIGARPARLARGEMAADVAGADGAEQRVGQRVQADVGIGMAEQAERAGDADAEQDDAIAGRQPMHVEAEASAGPPCRPEQPLGADEIGGFGDLHVVLVASHECDRDAVRLGQRGIVGHRRPDEPPVRAQDPLVHEPLRRLRPVQVGALDRARDDAVGAALQRVGHRQDGSAAAQVRKACSTRSITVGLTRGRAPSWISTSSGDSRSRLSRPSRTESCLVGPPGTGSSTSSPSAAAA